VEELPSHLACSAKAEEPLRRGASSIGVKRHARYCVLEDLYKLIKRHGKMVPSNYSGAPDVEEKRRRGGGRPQGGDGAGSYWGLRGTVSGTAVDR